MTSRHLTYRQIADDLQRRIHCGEYPPGSAIPTYHGLSARYEVSVPTAKRAVSVLRERGLVRGIPWRGVFVQPADPAEDRPHPPPL